MIDDKASGTMTIESVRRLVAANEDIYKAKGARHSV